MRREGRKNTFPTWTAFGDAHTVIGTLLYLKQEGSQKLHHRCHVTLRAETKVLSLGTLKDLITNEYLKVNNELKDFREDFRKTDSRLSLIETKFDSFEKTTSPLQMGVKGLREVVHCAERKIRKWRKGLI